MFLTFKLCTRCNGNVMEEFLYLLQELIENKITTEDYEVKIFKLLGFQAFELLTLDKLLEKFSRSIKAANSKEMLALNRYIRYYKPNLLMINGNNKEHIIEVIKLK